MLARAEYHFDGGAVEAEGAAELVFQVALVGEVDRLGVVGDWRCRLPLWLCWHGTAAPPSVNGGIQCFRDLWRAAPSIQDRGYEPGCQPVMRQVDCKKYPPALTMTEVPRFRQDV